MSSNPPGSAAAHAAAVTLWSGGRATNDERGARIAIDTARPDNWIGEWPAGRIYREQDGSRCPECGSLAVPLTEAVYVEGVGSVATITCPDCHSVLGTGGDEVSAQ